MRRLFVFRPQPAASRTVDKARALGLEVTALPLFELESLDWAVPERGRFDAILLTSANAVTQAGSQIEQLRELPVHAVGDATAVAASVAGLGVATVGSAGVDQLLASIDPGIRLLHLCGEDRRSPVSPAQPITTIPVYRAKVVDGVDLAALQGHVALVHSPRAGGRLAELVEPRVRASVAIVAISAPAAEAAGGGWEDVRIARGPNDTELLALAARLCDT